MCMALAPVPKQTPWLVMGDDGGFGLNVIKTVTEVNVNFIWSQPGIKCGESLNITVNKVEQMCGHYRWMLW